MYNDLKKFLEGKDPQFMSELHKINDIDQQLITDPEQVSILKKYKQTEAYKRLLKRQGLAVKRIERIKETFEKKRKQVEMLAIQRGGSYLNNSASDKQLEGNMSMNGSKTPKYQYIPANAFTQEPIY